MAKKVANAKGPIEEIFGVTPEKAMELLGSLTGRELETATLLATGGKAENLAKEMGISRKTFDIHRNNIRMKLATRTGVDIARIVYAAKVGQHFQ